MYHRHGTDPARAFKTPLSEPPVSANPSCICKSCEEKHERMGEMAVAYLWT